MKAAHKEWLTLAELAFEAAVNQIPGLPVSDNGMLHFIRAHKIDDNPDLCRDHPKRPRAKIYHRAILERFRQEDSDDWLLTGDICRAKLPGLPNTSWGMDTFLKKAGWREVPEKSRERRKNGGGFEYHVSLLPAEAQAAWLAHCQEQRATVPPQAIAATDAKPAFTSPPDLSTVRNSALLAELLTRVFRALGDETSNG